MNNRPSTPTTLEQPLSDAVTASPVIQGPAPPYAGLGYIFAVLGAILFSTKAIVAKLLYEQNVDPETLLALRMLLALPFYLLIGAYSVRDRFRAGRRLPSRKLVLSAVGTGLLGYWLGSYFDFVGLQYVSVQIERMILFTYPVFVLIFGFLFFNYKISAATIFAILLSYCGIGLIFSQNVVGSPTALIGVVLIFASAIAAALNQLFSKKLIDTIGPRFFTCVAMTGVAVAAFIQFTIFHSVTDLVVSPEALIYAGFLAIGATVLPTFLLSAALQRISSQSAVAIGTLSPVATIFLAHAVLGETMSTLAWAGTALVMAGVGWSTVADQRARKRANAPVKDVAGRRS